MLFIVSGVLGTVLAVVFCLAGRAGTGERHGWWSRPGLGPVVQVAVAGAGVAAGLGAFRLGRRHLIAGASVPSVYLLFSVVVVGATVAVALLRRRPSAPPSGSGPLSLSTPEVAALRPPASRWGRRGWILDVLFVVVVVAVVYQPYSRLLAGSTFQLDSMLHWDYFSMGPTLSYGAGAALGTDVHVFYGVGWPLLFHALSPVLSVSYAHMIEAAQIYGCLYLVGAYVFLRLFVRDAAWAVTGVVLVLLFHLFARSAAPFAPYWGFPSLSLVRYTFDVWVLAAVVLSLRSTRQAWDVVAGVLVGLAVLFEIDTGVYLAAAMGYFWLCRGAAATGADRLSVARRAVLATASGAAVLLVGLAFASRGTLVHQAFWSGWLENMRAASAGFGMEPLATGTPGWTIRMLVLVIAVDLFLVSHAAVAAIRGRLTRESLVLGTLAGYSFLVTLYFIGRSTPFNLARSAVSFALLLAALGARGSALGATRLRARAGGEGGWWVSPWVGRAPGMAALVLAVVLLVQNPVFRAHRGLAREALGGGPSDGLCLLEHPKDLCGIAPAYAPVVDGLRLVADRLRQLGSHGERVAVLDQTGPLFYLASGTAPWGRYSPLLLSLYSQRRLESVTQDLESDPPDVVVIQAADIPLFRDTVTVLRAIVHERFDLDSELAGYQIWLRRPTAAGA